MSLKLCRLRDTMRGREAKDRLQERWNPPFVCVDTYAGSFLQRLTDPSADNWAVRELLSAVSQRLTLPPLPPPSSKSRGEVRVQVSSSLPATMGALVISMSVGCQMTPPAHHLTRPRICDQLFSPKTQPEAPPSSFTLGRLLWLYDYIWGFVWLRMYLHHSQLVPINNKAPV